MKLIDRLGDAVIEFAADASDGRAVANLRDRVVDAVMFPVAVVFIVSLVALDELASRRSS